MNSLSELANVALTGDYRIDSLLDDPSPWNFLLPYRNVLYYTFDASAGSYIDLESAPPVTAFNSAQRDAARAILGYAGGLIGVQFVEVASSAGADIHFGATDLSGGSVTGLNSSEYSYSYIGDTIVSLSAESGIYLDNAEFLYQNGTPTAGSQGYQTLLHEIGHALGLGHPFDYPNALPAGEDNTNYTVMSYTPAGATKSTFQQYDLWALTWIYGADGLGGSWGYNSTYGNSLSPGAGDTTAPVVASFQPVDGATGVPVGSDLVLTFSEGIQRGTGYVVLKTTAGVVVETFNAATSTRLTVTGDTLVINPSANLAFGTQYRLEFAPGTIRDLAGNSYAGSTAYDWTTTAAPDTAPPTVLALDPADGAAGVGAGSNITLTFSESIQRGTGDIVLRTASGAVAETFNAATSVRLDFVGQWLIVNPSINLAYSTGYRLDIAAGAVKDLAGNPYAGLTTYDFAVQAAPDTTPPTIALSTSDASLVAGETARITFALSEASTSFTASDVTVSGGILSNFSGSGTSYGATFTPTANSTANGVVRVASGRFSDAAGNSNADGAEANNTVTMAVNTQAPVILGFNPADDAIDVAVGRNLVVTFNEAIKRGAGEIVLKTTDGRVVEHYDAATSGNIAISGSTLTLNPSADLDIYTGYLVEFSRGSIKDLAGNDYLPLGGYDFRTETVDELYHFFVVAFAAAPGVEYMTQLAEAYNYGLSVQEIVNIFTTKPQFTSVYPLTLTDDQLATRLVSNIVKDSASEANKLEAVHDIRDALGLGWSRGDVIHQVFGNLADKPLDDPQWGATARQFQNQTAVARYLTEVMEYDTTDLPTLQAVLADVTPYTDVSTPVQIAQLIGVALG